MMVPLDLNSLSQNCSDQEILEILGEQFKKSKDLLPGYYFLKCKKAKYLYFDESLRDILQFKHDGDIIGKKDEDLGWIESHKQRLIHSDKKILSEQIAQNLVFSIKKNEIDFHYINIMKSPLIVKGRCIGLVGVACPITQNHDDLFELKSKAELLEDIIYNLPGLIYWKNKRSEYVGYNKNVVDLSGLNKEDLYRKTDKELNWGEKQAEGFIQDDLNVVTSGKIKITEHEIPIKRPDGNPMTVRTEKSRLQDREGNILGILGVAMDITDQKEAERLRVEKAEAEEREETMRLLAASMAHELRTPLRAISMGMTSVISKFPTLLETYKKAKAADLDIPYMYPADIESLEKVLGNIQLATREAFETVDMLVVKSGLSSIDTSNFQKCSISECIKTALHRYPLKESEKNLVKWQEDDFDFVGDYSLMVHVIFNLLKNALYFVAAAGKGDISIWLEKGDGYNKLYFKDTGRGIPEDIMPRIFEPFFTTVNHGTGVGLAFSEFVMKSMGGEIECHSEHGKFTEFILSFPRYEGDA